MGEIHVPSHTPTMKGNPISRHFNFGRRIAYIYFYLLAVQEKFAIQNTLKHNKRIVIFIRIKNNRFPDWVSDANYQRGQADSRSFIENDGSNA